MDTLKLCHEFYASDNNCYGFGRMWYAQAVGCENNNEDPSLLFAALAWTRVVSKCVLVGEMKR